MTLNDEEGCVREWLEKLYALAGPGSEMARMALAVLDEQNALLEEKSEEIDRWADDIGEFDEAKRDLEDYDHIRELCVEAELVDESDLEQPLALLLRMFLPI